MALDLQHPLHQLLATAEDAAIDAHASLAWLSSGCALHPVAADAAEDQTRAATAETTAAVENKYWFILNLCLQTLANLKINANKEIMI